MSSRSQVFAPTSSQIERAWYLLTVLLRLDHPASPAELASRSAVDSIFLSPDLVEFLCRIPGSPISLTRGGLIVGSEVAVAVFRQYLGLTPGSFVPRVLSRFSEERRGWSSIKLMYVRKRKMRSLEAGLMGPSAKRRLLWSSDGDVEETRRDDQLGIQSSADKALKVHIDVDDAFTNSLSAVLSSSVLSQGIALIPSLRNINVLSEGLAMKPSISNVNSLLSSFEIENDVHLRRDGLSETMCGTSHNMILGQESHDNQPIVVQKEIRDNTQAITVHKVLELFGSNGLHCGQNAIISDPVVGTLKMREPDLGSALGDKAKDKPLFCIEILGEDNCIVPAAPLAIRYEVNPVSSIFLGAENGSNEPSVKLGSLHVQTSRHPKNEVDTNVNYCETAGISFQTDASRREQDRSVFTAEPGTILEQQRMSFERPKIMDGVASHEGFQRSFQEPNSGRNDNSPKREQDIRNEKGVLVKQKMRRSRIPNAPLKENKKETIPMISKINSETKSLPNFESFVIVEEEGSGGYGTVYRVRRKEDEQIFAVKYPHPNAHSHHINNELKMLERFGGRNFVIKYEGSFRKGQSVCFVLEHVEHDRPEVLKKEIDVFEVQWYGYCMFRALASLHKQGIAHRDVKPGNFLFSRKLNKGYLIDFNLASDLHQKFSKSSRSGNKSNADLDPLSLSITKSSSYNQAGIGRKNHVLDNIRREVAKDSRKVLLKNMKGSSKGPIETFPNIESANKYGSQAADSGVTSAKDPTSTRTNSADMLKQPIIPYKGRKELINFVHEAMQSPNYKEVTGPASQRKRVAAPLGKMDNNRLIIPTPMPLHSGGNAVAGAGTFNRGNRKHKREGPCVGTKGFRAPEVLFKSCHQGCKIDVWSAGVTLLYLIIGKTPFGGDPEQNIRDIAKLRGSEDLWEVAKLHNCESSYPPDLLDVQFLPTTKLRDWCLMNTKRPEFLELVPDSLFDLLDKCLAVNPRCRITAEEALMHRFSGPCHESLRKQRLLRRVTSSEPEKLPLC